MVTILILIMITNINKQITELIHCIMNYMPLANHAPTCPWERL